MHTNTFWLKFGGLSLAVTLKIRSRSPKPIQLFTCPNVISMQIWLKSASWFMRYFAHKHSLAQIWQFSPAVTLKNRSGSPKPNQLFIMSQSYIHAHLVEICQPVHEIWSHKHFYLFIYFIYLFIFFFFFA